MRAQKRETTVFPQSATPTCVERMREATESTMRMCGEPHPRAPWAWLLQSRSRGLISRARARATLLSLSLCAAVGHGGGGVHCRSGSHRHWQLQRSSVDRACTGVGRRRREGGSGESSREPRSGGRSHHGPGSHSRYGSVAAAIAVCSLLTENSFIFISLISSSSTSSSSSSLHLSHLFFFLLCQVVGRTQRDRQQ